LGGCEREKKNLARHVRIAFNDDDGLFFLSLSLSSLCLVYVYVRTHNHRRRIVWHQRLRRCVSMLDVWCARVNGVIIIIIIQVPVWVVIIIIIVGVVASPNDDFSTLFFFRPTKEEKWDATGLEKRKISKKANLNSRRFCFLKMSNGHPADSPMFFFFSVLKGCRISFHLSLAHSVVWV
jgi:hypothetical protein